MQSGYVCANRCLRMFLFGCECVRMHACLPVWSFVSVNGQQAPLHVVKTSLLKTQVSAQYTPNSKA